MRMRDELEQKVGLRFSKGLMAADDKEIYLALLELTQEKLEAAAKIQGERKLYYISAEFLVGKLLSNNLINLGIYGTFPGKRRLGKTGRMLSGFCRYSGLARGRRGAVVSFRAVPPVF